MAHVADLPFKYRALMKVYPWRRLAPMPPVTLSKPLSEARVALITSGGLIEPGQEPFDETIKGGDHSYRVIRRETATQSLLETHRSDAFDHSGIAMDRNLALPLDRLKELSEEGEIGSVAPRHLSFMGSITAPGRLARQSAPEAAELLVDDQVDVVLLVPV